MGSGKQLIISATGFPATNETWRFIQQAWREPLEAIAKESGDKTILTGLVNDGNGTYSKGYVSYNGEILLFESGAYQDQVTLIDTEVTAAYDADLDEDSNQDVLPVYKTRYLRFGTGGVETFPFSDLIRLKTLKELTAFASQQFVPTEGYIALTQAMVNFIATLEEGAEVNVKSDWNNTSPQSDAYIQNKPFQSLKVTRGSIVMTTLSQGQLQNDMDYNCAYIFPPSGYSVTNLAGFIPSLAEVYFDGEVNQDDTLWCKWAINYADDKVKIFANNSEHRQAPKVNWLAIWIKN
ncbi:hypothetical protein NBRC110019_07330 [Neptunitalea chrysea]|uniref:Uncharacterized protein n=1 Tax=Neptunitalea chrysea TaxID=1647581 RepID=A0A9W6ETV1_9FLAO|nr:hypothetical protein [Neptunitalea chrysea]GLB51694.1 hypothetical protein NBRC110019_07330 [Neptunitalea chrysea]